MPPTDRRSALLDATLELIGEGGLAAATHRRVEARVGLPHGTTTYWFKSKRALLDAAVDRLLERDRARADEIGRRLAAVLAPRGPLDELDYDGVAAALVRWLDQDRTLHLARYELFVAAGRDAELAPAMNAALQPLVALLEPLVLAAGSTAPARDARIALATLNGLLLEQLIRPQADFATSVLPVALRKLMASLATP